APGTENSATRRPLKNSSDATGWGPSAVALVKLVSGTLSPTLIVIASAPRLCPVRACAISVHSTQGQCLSVAPGAQSEERQRERGNQVEKGEYRHPAPIAEPGRGRCHHPHPLT